MYVGFTNNFEKRPGYHFADLSIKSHDNQYLQAAYNKYGAENFVFEPLVECEERFLVSEEHYWATILNTHNAKYGYNILPTNPYGKLKMSAESIAKRNKTNSEKPYLFRPNKYKGVPRSQETKDRIRNATLGVKKIMSSEQKAKQIERSKLASKNLIKFNSSEEGIQKLRMTQGLLNGKAVLQLNKSGELVKEFISVAETIRSTNVTKRKLYTAIVKNTKLEGYFWKFKE